MSVLELWDSHCLITLLKMGVDPPFLAKFTLLEVLNIWVFLTSTEPVGPCGLTISWLPVLVGETMVPPPTRTGEFILGDLTEVLQSLNVVLSLPVLLTPPGFQRTRALLRTASVMNTSKVCVRCVWGVPTQVTTPSGIWGSIAGVMIGRVRLLYIFVASLRW